MGYRAENLMRLLKAATPTLLGLVGVFILAAPIRLFEGHIPTPIIPLVVVFFWSIYSPDALPAPGIFAIGLLQDFLTGSPLGLWAFVYLATQFIVSSQRSYFLGREQKVVWLGFTFASVAAGLVLWMLMNLLIGAILPVRALVFQLFATVMIYPAFGFAFRQLHRRVLIEV